MSFTQIQQAVTQFRRARHRVRRLPQNVINLNPQDENVEIE